MSQAFKHALTTPDGRRMLLEMKAYTHSLPESLMIGAQHIVNWMEVKANAEERAKGRDPIKPAKLTKEKPTDG